MKELVSTNIISLGLAEMALNIDMELLSYHVIEKFFRKHLRTDASLGVILRHIENEGFFTPREPNLRVQVEQIEKVQ